jgi:hypothetical protein
MSFGIRSGSLEAEGWDEDGSIKSEDEESDAEINGGARPG